MGFIPDVRRIVYQTPRKRSRQTLFFSATFNDDVMNLAAQWTLDPEHVAIRPESLAVETVDQRFWSVSRDTKRRTLLDFVRKNKPDHTLVFVNRRDAARTLTGYLQRQGVRCESLAGDIPQRKRLATMRRFKDGDTNLVIATDVAGRGIHVEGISHVINYGPAGGSGRLRASHRPHRACRRERNRDQLRIRRRCLRPAAHRGVARPRHQVHAAGGLKARGTSVGIEQMSATSEDGGKAGPSRAIPMSERLPSSPLLALAALVVVAAGIKAAEQVMVPFLLAAFIATIAATPVFWLHRHRLPVGLAITVVVLGLVAVLVGFGAIVAESADAFRERLPFYQERAVALLEPVLAFLGGLGVELSPELLDPGRALGFAGDALGSLGSVLTNSFFILLAVVFILTEAWSFPRKLGTVLSHPERDLPHFKRFAEKLNRYFAIKTSVSVATGVFVGLALWLLGVDFPILWGLLAFMLNYVPNIGSVIAAIPPVLLAIMQLGPVSAVATAAVFLGGERGDGQCRGA